MDGLIETVAARGDLAHLALFLWASAATTLLIFVTRELSAAMRRFDDFVRELARFNELSFEWSPLTLNSAFFNKSTRLNGVTELSCVEMIRAP